MIVDWVVGIVMGFMTGLFGLIPAWVPPGEFGSAGSALGGAIGAVNGVFPVVTLGVVLLVLLAVRLMLWGWSILVFLYDRIPFKAT